MFFNDGEGKERYPGALDSIGFYFFVRSLNRNISSRL